MKIEIVLDEEDGLDAIDVLGDIRLESRGDAIEEECTFVDSWLWALVESLGAIEEGRQLLIDLVVEPEPLAVRSCSEGISIRYKDRELIISDIGELRNGLLEAARTLVNRFETMEHFDKNEMLCSLRRFSS